MLQLGYKVIIFGQVIATGTERFSSAPNAVLMLRSRHMKDLPASFAGAWSLIEVSLH